MESMITINTFRPRKLAEFIKTFWCLTVNSSSPAYQEDIIPDGHPEIIIQKEHGCAKRRKIGGTWVVEPESFIAGQNLSGYQVQIKEGSVLYGIRFYPHTLSLLCPFPAYMITDQIIPFEEIFKIDELRNCIRENPEKTFSNLESFLEIKILSGERRLTKLMYLNQAISAILSNKGFVKIDNLVLQSGLSARYINTLFDRFVGIRPKQLCRIVQMNFFIHYQLSHPEKKITECCYEASFFDQSHLIKSFRDLTNTTPRAYFKDTNYINNYFSGL